MKRLAALLTLCILLFSLAFPACAFAKAKQMNDDVPVWTEESVRRYVLDYIGGKDMSRLYGYYDLQIRRYMPLSAYEAFLTDLEFFTGAFVELGDYESFSDPEQQLKTHVLHLCMEKQDLDLYFTHKDKEDDWEVMALQFVPADKAAPAHGDAVATEAKNAYTETEVTVGTSQKPLQGILTLPADAVEGKLVPGCVLVHDWGALDKNSALGATRFFEDLAHALADLGVASLRYDKRTYAYGGDDDSAAMSDMVEDALLAGDIMKANLRVDKERLVLIGHGLGAILGPRIVAESNGVYTGMVLIGGTPKALTQLMSERGLSVDAAGEAYDSVKTIMSLKLPTYIVQGSQDAVVSENDGWRLYSEDIGDGVTYVSFKSFRGLNHLLMNDLSVDGEGKPTYEAAATLDKAAGRSLAQWILSMNLNQEE